MFLATLLVAHALVLAAKAPGKAGGRYEFLDYSFHGSPRHYAVWLPPGYDGKSHGPAILFLHGADESGSDGRKPVRVGLGPALEARPASWPFVVLFPQKPRDNEEWWEEEEFVRDVIRRARKEYAFDSQRMALVGVSQGGHGVWMIGARSPNPWSCLVPISSYGRPRTIATRVPRLPVWAFHGLRDDTVNPDDCKKIVSAIRAERTRLGLENVDAKLTLYPDEGHGAWDKAFAEPELPKWILRQMRAR